MKRKSICLFLVILLLFTPLISGFTYLSTAAEQNYEKTRPLFEQEYIRDQQKKLIDEHRLNHFLNSIDLEDSKGTHQEFDKNDYVVELEETLQDIQKSLSEDKNYDNPEMIKDALNEASKQNTKAQEYVTIYEEEPNDLFNQANPINLKSDVYGTITETKDDIDRFKFSVKEPGTFEVMGFWMGEFYDWGWEDDLFFLISKAGNEDDYFAHSAYYEFEDETGMQYLEVDLDEGEYFITLIANDEYGDLYVEEPYVLLTDFFPEEPIDNELPIFYEVEPNNNPSEANVINLDTLVVGWIDKVSDDIDYFEMELDRAGRISIGGIWVGDYVDQGWEDDLYIFIVDESEEILYVADLYQFDDGTAMVYMEEEIDAGTYYIVVFASQEYGDLYVGEPYIFDVLFEGFEDEHRISGANRYLTAYEIAKNNDPNPETVIIVRGDSVNGIPQVVDGLTASGLAGAMDAQILMVRSNLIPEGTWDALSSLSPKNVVIVGGTAAVSEEIRIELEDYGLKVDRISGSNRYATAVEVALAMGEAKNNTAIIVDGRAVVDSLVAGPLANKGYPILMVNNSRGIIPEETQVALKELNIEKVLIVGGTGVVSQAIEDQLNALPGVIVEERYGGATRIETSIALGEHQEFDKEQQVTIVNGWSYVDAVAASTIGSPVIYFRDRLGITEEIKNYLVGKNGFKVIGGTSVVTHKIYGELLEIMQ